jgi:hypothetical protein
MAAMAAIVALLPVRSSVGVAGALFAVGVEEVPEALLRPSNRHRPLHVHLVA